MLAGDYGDHNSHRHDSAHGTPAGSMTRLFKRALSGRLVPFDGLDGDLGLQAGRVTLSGSWH